MTVATITAALLQAQRAEHECLPLWRGVLTGALQADALDVQQLVGVLRQCSAQRVVCEHLLQRLPAANDGAPHGPRAA